MKKLYKATFWARTTVNEVARLILEAETDAPANSYRRVQLFIPSSPNVQIGLDSLPKDIAMSREYFWPNAPSSQTIILDLQPEQFISAVSTSAYAELSLCVEYVVET